MQASASGTYLNDAQVVLQFNTSAFGSSLFASTAIDVKPTGCFAANYFFTYAADKATNQVLLHLYIKNTVAGFTREEVPSYAQKAEPFAHVKIKIKTCAKNTGLSIVDLTNTCAVYSSAADRQVPTPVLYDYAGYDIASQLNKNTCELSISNLTPTQVTAGTFDGTDTVVIQGSGFGATRYAPYKIGTAAPKGEVLLYDADLDNTYIPELNDVDYLSWTDSEIHLRVPSCVGKKGIRWYDYNKHPGSGLFKVRNYMNDSATSIAPARLDIVYSLASHMWTADTVIKYREYLANLDGAKTGDIKFVVSKNLARNPVAVQCVEKALQAWSCEISINLSLVRDTLGNVIISNKTKPDIKDPRNVIYINDSLTTNPSPTKGALMSTSTSPQLCVAPPAPYGGTAFGIHPIIAIANFDTAANTTGKKWFYDATGTLPVPPNQFDFYSALLHELGHVLMLEHVIDPNRELMFWTQGPELAVNQRVNLKSSRTYNGSYPSIAGVRNIIAASIKAVYNGCANVAPLTEKILNLCGTQVIPNLQNTTLFQATAFNLPYYVTGSFNAGNVFTVQLSDASGIFGSLSLTSATTRTKTTTATAAAPTVIGTLAATGSGSISCTVPASVPVGTGYKIRITASNPATVGPATDFALAVVPAGATLNTGSIATSTVCTGKQVVVPYTFSNLTFAAGNVFTAQLSNAAGSFASPVNIGTLSSVATSTITATIPAGTAAGEGYRVRVVSSSPLLTASDNGANITVGVTPAKPTITASGATTFCEGGSVTLTSSAASGNTWSPGGVTTQGMTANTSGSYSVIITADNGCVSSASNAVAITVNPNVPLTASISCSPSNQLCPGGSNVTFTAQATNGSSTVTYQWKLNGNNVGTNSATYSTGSLIAGNNVQCVVTATNGCFTNNPANSNTITMANAANVYPDISINATPRYINYPYPPLEQIQWTNANDHCSTTGTSIEATNKLTGVRGYANIVQQISEGGFIDASVPETPTYMRIYLGFGTTNFDYYFKLEENNGYGSLYAMEPGGSKLITSNYTKSSMLRIAIIHNKVCFFYKGVLQYVSSNSITTPASLMAEIYFGSAVAGTFRIENMQLKKSNTTFIFDVLAENAGTNPTYQWNVNSISVGSNSPQYECMQILNDGDKISCQVTSSNFCKQTTTATYQVYRGAFCPNDYIYDSSIFFGAPISVQACRNIDILSNVNIKWSEWQNFFAGNEINIGNGTDSDLEIGPDVNFEILPCISQSNVMSALSQEGKSLNINNNEDENSSITIFPNPASGKVFVQFRQNEVTKNNITVFSITGPKLFETGYFTMGEGIKAINISSLSIGVYILNIEMNGEVIKRKVVVR